MNLEEIVIQTAIMQLITLTSFIENGEKIAEEKAERDRQVSKWLTSENVLIFVVRHYEKNSPSDWRIYAPIVNAPMFEKFSRNQALPIGCVEEKADGEFTVYGKKFARKW